MTSKTKWVTNANSLDYNSGSDTRVYYVLTSLLSSRPEYNSVSNKSLVLPVDSNLAISFSCNCCVAPVGCYFRLNYASFTLNIDRDSFTDEVTNIYGSSLDSVTYDVYSSSGAVVASNLTHTVGVQNWTLSSDKSYASLELVVSGSASGYNDNAEARCTLFFDVSQTDGLLNSYLAELSDFTQSDTDDYTSLGLTPFVYYGTNTGSYGTSYYYPLCESDSTPCYAVYLGNSTQVAYTYDSSSSSYVPNVVSQGLSLYRTQFSDGTSSNIWGLQCGATSGTGNVVRVLDDYNGFVLETELTFNNHTSSYYIVFYPEQEITSAISGTLFDLVSSGVLKQAIFPYLNNASTGTAFFRDSDGACSCSDCFDMRVSIDSRYTNEYQYYYSAPSLNTYDLHFVISKTGSSSVYLNLSSSIYNEFDAFLSSNRQTLQLLYNPVQETTITLDSKTFVLKYLMLTMTYDYDYATGIGLYHNPSNAKIYFDEQ